MRHGNVFKGFDQADFDVFAQSKVRSKDKRIQAERNQLNLKLRELAADLETFMLNLDERFHAKFPPHWIRFPNQEIRGIRISYAFERAYTKHPQLNVEVSLNDVIVFLYLPPEVSKKLHRFFLDAPQFVVEILKRLNPIHGYARTVEGKLLPTLVAADVTGIARHLSSGTSWFVMGEDYSRQEEEIFSNASFVSDITRVFERLYPLFLIARGEETNGMKLLDGLRIDGAKQLTESGNIERTATKPTEMYTMIRNAAESIGGRMTYAQIVEYVDKKFPNTNLGSVESLIRAFTVNNPYRIKGYKENWKPSDDPSRRSELYDVLYRPNPNKKEVELYDSKKHGEWVISRTKRTASNPQGVEVKLARAGTASSAAKARGVSKARVGRHLSRAQIEALIEAFRGFMSTYEGVQALKRRNLDEPDQVTDLLKKARVAQRKGNWKVFLSLIYYGVLPSKKRKSELGYDRPSAPSGTTDLLAMLRKQAGYKESAIRKQACRLVDIMNDASSGRVKAVIRKSVDLENSPYAWGIRLGQITPSLFALDNRLMIVNKRVIQSFKQMSMNVLGTAMSLSTKLSKYQNALDELAKFQSQLASSYDFHEVLDNHWLNLFFSKSFEWKFRAKKRYSFVARQMDPAKRKKIEQLAMNFAIKQEESRGRRCTDVSSTESYDILSTDQLGGDPKFVEVKGHSRNDRTAWLTRNEYNLALRERDKYILYIVYNLDTGKPSHRRIVNPLSKMKVEPKEILSYFLS